MARSKPANPPQYLNMDFPEYEYKHFPCYGHKGKSAERVSILVNNPEEQKAAEADDFEFPVPPAAE